MLALTPDSGRYLLDVQLACPARSELTQPSLTIIDELRQTTVSQWRGPAVLVLLGRSCLPLFYRRPGRHRCDRYLVGHLICAGAALTRGVLQAAAAGSSPTTEHKNMRVSR